MKPSDRLVFPLDVPTLAEASHFIDLLKDDVGVFKVGLELFTAEGPAAVRRVLETSAKCFLDLKLHDISETMARAVRAAANLGVHYLTIHASAGVGAMERCVEAARGTDLQLLAITVLTSLRDEDLRDVGLRSNAKETSLRLATLASNAGIGGFVTSAEELETLRQSLGPQVTLVVPGIRPLGTALGDQQRVATPKSARLLGADLLVVGRPIRDAADPRAAARDILSEIVSAEGRQARNTMIA